MPITVYEATAQLAAYAHESRAYGAYGLAGDVATGQQPNPQAAIDVTLRDTQNHPKPFEAWRAKPDTAATVEARVVLQEKFAAYEESARFVTTPFARWVGYSSLRKLSGGSQARGYRFDADGEMAVLKQPLGSFNGRWRREPLTNEDRARFAEDRLRNLPTVPGVPNFERMKAISYAGSVITNYLTGKQLWRLSEPELESITDEDLAQAVRDNVTLGMAGVLLDGNGANTLHMAGEGFKFFDPLKGNDTTVRYALFSNLKSLGRNIRYEEDDFPPHNRTPNSERLRADLFSRLSLIAPQAHPVAAEILADPELEVWKNIQ